MRVTLLFAGGGTGGHVFPLVAVADAVRSLEPSANIVFVGTARGMETRVVPARGYPLELMDVLPLRGGGVLGAVRGAFRALGALVEARALVARLAPDAVLSIGGYAAGPVSLCARLTGVPLALLEPNSVMGLANRLVAPVVSRAYTAFEGAEGHFARGKVRRYGVPIRRDFRPVPLRSGRPARLLVLGGSQGARRLNENVPEAVGRAESTVSVLHQCGKNDVDAVTKRYARVASGLDVRVTPFIDDMPGALAEADVVIARSGASAVSEICAVGRASILVPYPFAAGDHQRANAAEVAGAGAAVLVADAQASPERIAQELDALCGDPERLEHMAQAARGLGRPDAALDVARDLLQLAGKTSERGELAARSPAGGDRDGTLCVAQHGEAG